MPKFLVALSIPQLGEETALDIAYAFGTLTAVSEASREALLEVPGVGGIVADSIYEWFRTDANKELVRDLLKHVEIRAVKKMDKKSLFLSGKTFVLTGTLSALSREEAKEAVRERGGSVSGAVSKETAYVVAGENTGSKYEKAKELGVEVIDEKEFLRLLGR